MGFPKVRLTRAVFDRVCVTYAETGRPQASALAHGVSYPALKDALKADADWADQWEAAYGEFQESLEEEIVRRGVRGVEEPVFYQGVVVGHITRYSDRMLELAAKGAMPEKYRDNVKVDASVRAAGVLLAPPSVTLDQFRELLTSPPEPPPLPSPDKGSDDA